jgi:hypothetical protein
MMLLLPAQLEPVTILGCQERATWLAGTEPALSREWNLQAARSAAGGVGGTEFSIVYHIDNFNVRAHTSHQDGSKWKALKTSGRHVTLRLLRQFGRTTS